MSSPYLMALLGFPTAEHAALLALLRVMSRRGQEIEATINPVEAQLTIANADDPVVMARVRMLPLPRVLLVGKDSGGTAWPLQQRPLKLLAVLDALDQLIASPPAAQPPAAPLTAAPLPTSATAAPEPVAFAATVPFQPSGHDTGSGGVFAATQPFAPLEMGQRPAAPLTEFAATQPFAPLDGRGAAVPQPWVARPMDADIDAASIARWRAAQLGVEPEATPVAPPAAVARAPAAEPAPFLPSSDFLGVSGKSVAVATPDRPLDEVLLVDSGDLSRRELQNRLHRRGYRADMVRTGEEAIVQAGLRPYRLIFIDELAGAMDAFQTLRALRQCKPVAGKRAQVVLLSPRGGAFDRLRAKLAGCDIYLTKPVADHELERVLARVNRP